MQRFSFRTICIALAFAASLSKGEASDLKITKIPSNGGYIETARVSFHHHRLYVDGWARPQSWGTGRISVKVDLKDADGNVIATQTDSSLITGRPQLLRMFGVSYGVSFEEAQVKEATAVDVSYSN